MLEAFRKKANKVNENLVMPDSADPNVLAEDGNPMTEQIQGIINMRDEIADEKPTAHEITVREPSTPVDTSKAVNSDLLDVPKLCDQCYLIDKCPHYKAGASCFFRNSVHIHDSKGLVDLMKMVLQLQGERVLFGRLIEQSEGGYLDQNLSKEMKLLLELMKDFKEVISEPKDEVSIKVSTKAGGIGGGQSGGGGGILSALFGGGGGGNQDG